uniref:BTB domain-containing protein n=1 Tax=Caenorhabditis tropicalis TaxID=1561998 RepID=A0A1I7TXE6_9PELO
MASQNAIIKLNVGGEVFKTTKSTLKKFDGFLKTLVETSIPVVRDADGCYIIQRNSKHFALILNYLRYGSIRLPGDYHTLKAISEEADYYLLFELRAMCDKKKHVVKKTLNIHKPKIRRSLPLFERQLRASIAALMRTCRMEMRRESERTRWEQSFVLRQAQHRVSN